MAKGNFSLVDPISGTGTGFVLGAIWAFAADRIYHLEYTWIIGGALAIGLVWNYLDQRRARRTKTEARLNQ